MKKSLVAIWLTLALLSDANASNHFNFYSETSHFVAGMALGGLVTWGVDGYWPEHRALIGFSVATAAGFIAEASSNNGFSSQDATANALGAAVGSWATDRWLLAPVVRRDAAGSTVGVVLFKNF